MRSFSALIRKDLKGYLDQPTGYILLVIFLAITSYMFFRTAMITAEATSKKFSSVNMRAAPTRIPLKRTAKKPQAKAAAKETGPFL